MDGDDECMYIYRWWISGDVGPYCSNGLGSGSKIMRSNNNNSNIHNTNKIEFRIDSDVCSVVGDSCRKNCRSN